MPTSSSTSRTTWRSAGNAPVKSLGEILDRGMYHTALEADIPARNAVESRDSDAARRARIKRRRCGRRSRRCSTSIGSAALVYPTLRRKPGAHRRGAGRHQLPGQRALRPAGARRARRLHRGRAADRHGAARRGVRRAAAAVARLCDRADADAARGRRSARRRSSAGKRRAPRTATAVVLGHGVEGQLRRDHVAPQLHAQTSVGGYAADRLAAVWIHLGTPDKPGAARHQLFGSGQPAAGSVTLSAADRKGAAEGRLLVRFDPQNGTRQRRRRPRRVRQVRAVSTSFRLQALQARRILRT